MIPSVLAAVQLALGQATGKKIAEIGAGGGRFTRGLAELVGQTGLVVATDIDPQALAALSDRTRNLPQVVVRRTPSHHPALPNPPPYFDLAVLIQVDHLLGDLKTYLGELSGYLSETGQILVVNREDRLPALLAAADTKDYTPLPPPPASAITILHKRVWTRPPRSH